MYLFKEGKGWDRLPPDLDDPLMRQAMDVMEQFSEKEDDYALYRARQESLRIKLTDEALLQEARAEVEQERAAKEVAQAAKEQERIARERAEAELSRLREQMRQRGLDPES